MTHVFRRISESHKTLSKWPLSTLSELKTLQVQM